MPREPSRGSKLLRSLSLRSVGNDSGRDAYEANNGGYRPGSSSGLLPPRWSWSSMVRRSSMVSRNPSARNSRVTLDDDGKDRDYSGGDPSLQLLPRIRAVSPLILEDPHDDAQCVDYDATQHRQLPKFTLDAPTQLDIDDESDSEPPPSFRPLQFHLPLRLNNNSSKKRMSANAISRPVLTRRPAGLGLQPGVSRRYTFAMAMTDEDITDEALVKELERIRALRALSSASVDSGTSPPDIRDSHDFDDVWNLQEEQPYLELELQQDMDPHRLQFFSEGAVNVCDSPASEDSGEGWRTQSPTFKSATQSRSPPTKRQSLPAPSTSTSTSAGPRPVSLNPSLQPLSSSSSSSVTSWQTTRHALLTCRELVRTERHYLSSLTSLLSGETYTPPPPLMLHYTAVLVDVSRMFVERLKHNPTPHGVANAFIVLEQDMEAAYVGWSGVVGTWFIDGAMLPIEKEKAINDGIHQRATLKRLNKSRAGGGEDAFKKPPVSSWKGGFDTTATSSGNILSSASSSSSSSLSASSCSTTSPTSSISGCTSSSSRTSTSACTSVASTPGTASSTGFVASHGSKPTSMNSSHKGSSAPPSRTSSFVGNINLDQLARIYSGPNIQKERSVSGTSISKAPRKPTVRDLAILPTQRVMRYVLLFRDLLSSTAHASPSRATVERAAEAADRIAKKCDRAQNNAAFIVSPSPSNSAHDPLNAGSSDSKSPQGLKSSGSIKAYSTSKGKKEDKEGVKDKMPALRRKLTKSRQRGGLTEGPQRRQLGDEPSSSTASASYEGEQVVAGDSDESALPRRRSQSYTNVPAIHQPPKQSSGHKMHMMNFKVANWGLWPSESGQSSTPPSAFSTRSNLAARLSSPSLGTAT